MNPPEQSGPEPPQLQPPEMHSSLVSQTVVQFPQWFSSVMGSKQLAPQHMSDPEQSGPVPPHLQVPLAQLSPVSQAL